MARGCPRRDRSSPLLTAGWRRRTLSPKLKAAIQGHTIVSGRLKSETVFHRMAALAVETGGLMSAILKKKSRHILREAPSSRQSPTASGLEEEG